MSAEIERKRKGLEAIRDMIVGGDGLIGSTPRSRQMLADVERDLAELGMTRPGECPGHVTSGVQG